MLLGVEALDQHGGEGWLHHAISGGVLDTTLVELLQGSIHGAKDSNGFILSVEFAGKQTNSLLDRLLVNLN